MFSDLQKRYCEGDEDVIKQQTRTINKEECCENIFLIVPIQNKAIRPKLTQMTYGRYFLWSYEVLFGVS